MLFMSDKYSASIENSFLLYFYLQNYLKNTILLILLDILTEASIFKENYYIASCYYH